MQVKDIMQTDVAAVRPDDTVSEAARLMVGRRISGLPVVDAGGKLVGVLSEGDILRRAEFEAPVARSWLLDLIGAGETPQDYVRAHGKAVADVMTAKVETIAPSASVAEAARTLGAKGVKRLPVVEDGRLVGIVTRADVVRAYAVLKPEAPPAKADDATIRKTIMEKFANESALSGVQATVIVRDGVVELWGLASEARMIDAARVAAEEAPGVRAVQNHIELFPNAYYG